MPRIQDHFLQMSDDDSDERVWRNAEEFPRDEASSEGDVIYLDDPMDRATTAWKATQAAAEAEVDLGAHVANAIRLTESALIEVSLAGVRPEIVHAYLGVIGELHTLRDGRSRPLPNARIADHSLSRRRIEDSVASSRDEVYLTRRQRAVMELLLTGASTRKIAAELGLAEGTVKIHLTGIYRTLGVHSRAEAIAKLK